MKILVTGSKGTLGTHLVVELKKRGHEVWQCDLQHQRDQDYIRADVANYRQLERVFEQNYDYVYHLAAEFGRINGEEYYDTLWETNVIGTRNILEWQKKKGFRLIFASSSEIYGDKNNDILKEDLPLTSSIIQHNDYAVTKWVNEIQIMNFEKRFNSEIVRCRFFNSITKDQKVPVYLNGVFIYDSVENIYSKIGPDSNIVVPCFDKNNKMKLSKASNLVRERVKKDGYEIKTKFGRKVIVTGDHSLFIKSCDNKPKQIEARLLKKGDHIAIPKIIPFIEKDIKELNVIEKIEDLKWWYVDYPGLRDQVKNNKKKFYDSAKEIISYKGDRVSKLWWYIVKAKKGNIPLDIFTKMEISKPKTYNICFSGSTKKWIPNIINITDDVLWLIGLFIAEGCSYKNIKGSVICIDSDTEYLERASKILERVFGYKVSFYAHGVKKRQSPGIRIDGNSMYFLFNKVFKCLGKSKNKSIPDWVMTLPKKRVQHFLQGYHDGDGRKGDADKFDITSVSENLSDQILLLLNRWGYIGSKQKYTGNFKNKYYPFFRVYASGMTDYNPIKWDSVQNIQSKKSGDIVWANIKSIKKINIDDYVYDFTVPVYENFIAGDLVCCHNSYGPGEFYHNYRSVVCLFCYRALHNIPWQVYENYYRVFMYIEDFIPTLANVCESFIPGEVFNIGGLEYRSVKDLSDLVLQYTGANPGLVTYLPEDKHNTVNKRPDISKAIRDLSHNPTVTLEEGVPRTIEWMKAVY